MGWEQVWQLALKQFGAESIEVRIIIGLAVALCVLMIVEGLRATIRPVRPAAVPEPPALARPMASVARLAAKPSTLEVSKPQPFRATKPVARAGAKRGKAPVNRPKRADRMQTIRGKPASHSPLPPRR